MKQTALFCLLGFVCALVQTAVFPRVLPPAVRPDLFIVLVVALSLSANFLQGGIIAWILGAIKDVFAGQTLGLFGFVFIITFFLIKGTERRLNTDSALLLVLLVFFGSFISGGLTAAILLILDDAGRSWQVVLSRLPAQALVSSVAAWLVLVLLPRLAGRRSLSAKHSGAGLLGKRHES